MATLFPKITTRPSRARTESLAMTAVEIQTLLRQLGNDDIARGQQRFFKTAPGQYAAGDRFLGIKVPPLRRLARQYQELPLSECAALLRSSYHEERLLALLILVRAYQRGEASTRQAIHELYLASTSYVNNWDLVDVSAESLVGAHLADRPRTLLARLAESASLWERRIAILATFHFIKKGDFADLLHLASRLLADREDLIHKAVGWMLREVGKRDLATAEAFLQQHHAQMPRTMLRYAIERFPEPRRQAYLKGAVAQPGDSA